ncbi:MAG: hypothetical protein OXR73_04680 [Myxococcales bacterium]|nr:hypothetical protein [Myxococcales bacterium]
MEIESTVYFSHGDAAVNDALRALFELVCCNAHRYVEDPKKREKAFAAAANKMKAGSGKLAPLQKTIGKELGLTGGRRKAIPSPW